MSYIYLKNDWENLQLVKGKNGGGVKCEVGRARMTEPKAYVKLKVPYVIHAVAPNFSQIDRQKARRQLRAVYKNALSLTYETRKYMHDGHDPDDDEIEMEMERARNCIQQVAFPMLGTSGTKEVLFEKAVKGIIEWCGNGDEASLCCLNGLKDIVLCVPDIYEANIKTGVCDANLKGKFKLVQL
jgi:hypothetical protein